MGRKRKTPITIVDYNNMVELYHGESDRAAALMAGSVAEAITETLIRGFLRTGTNTDQLFEMYGPLSTFAARVNLAYALCIINEHLKRDLDYIRKIRNHFAHEPRETSFSVNPVKDLCKNLSTRDTNPEPRLQYLFATGLAVGQMHNILLSRKKTVQEERDREPSKPDGDHP